MLLLSRLERAGTADLEDVVPLGQEDHAVRDRIEIVDHLVIDAIRRLFVELTVVVHVGHGCEAAPQRFPWARAARGVVAARAGRCAAVRAVRLIRDIRLIRT